MQILYVYKAFSEETMTPIVVRCDTDYQTTIQIRQHTLIADEPVQAGGTDAGPTPLEMFVSTMGACIAVTTRAYAKHKQWPLEGISVEIEMERIKSEDYAAYSGDAPYVNEVREDIRFEGPLTEEQKHRLMQIAAKCPVHLAVQYPTFFVEKLSDKTLDIAVK